MISVIDVSNNNGPINWPAVAASGVEAAVIKASEGTVFADPWFSANWHEAKAAGLVRGAYHYGRPSVCSGHEEAAFLLQTVGDVGGLQPGDFLALDLEDPDVATGAEFLAYAPQSGSWREAATNLKGIADDALARGRAVVKVVGDAAAEASNVWARR